MIGGHLPVLVDEVLATLSPAPGTLHIDATLGGGGHTERILEAASPDGRVLGLDADPAAAAFFATLTGQNRYAILHRIHDAKRPETRARRIDKYVAMCAAGQTLH